MAAIGRLTAGVGHEVKNPINAIVVHLELLRNKLGGSDDNAMRHLEVIESEIQRLDRVVQTLVDFSRPVELQLKEQDLRRVVSSVLMLASAELETREVYVQSDLPDRPVMAKVDADLLKQALLNVVLNGAQAMAEGGKLEVRLAEDGRMALLSIHDQGEGIPDDIRDKIFDLYFTTKKDGSGIGLAMTYRIVQLHNGSIEVESDATQRNHIYFAFPFNSPQESRVRGYLMPDGSSQRNQSSLRSPGDEGGKPMLVVGALSPFSVSVLITTTPLPRAGTGAALADRKGTLSPPENSQPQEKADTPLASPLPRLRTKRAAAAAAKPKKVRHNRSRRPTKPAETARLLRPPPRGHLAQPRRLPRPLPRTLLRSRRQPSGATPRPSAS